MVNSVIDQIRQPRIHELRISESFGGDVFFNSNTAAFDRPLALLLFANRSGSNLLAEHLLASGCFSGLQETLNFDIVEKTSKKHGIVSFSEYFHAIATHNINENKNAFGTKCSLDQLIMLLRWNILSMFPSAKIINIERHDIVGQAVSMSIAVQTRSWSSETSPAASPIYDFKQIENYFTQFSADIIKRRALIDVLGLDAITFEYEQVVSEPLHVVSECCRLFGIPAPHTPPEQTRLRKQGGELNREFSARFREEARERLLTGR